MAVYISGVIYIAQYTCKAYPFVAQEMPEGEAQQEDDAACRLPDCSHGAAAYDTSYGVRYSMFQRAIQLYIIHAYISWHMELNEK